MKFREWFQVQEMTSAADRLFAQQFPGVPVYVRREILRNKIQPQWKRSIQAPTTNYEPAQSDTAAAPIDRESLPTTAYIPADQNYSSLAQMFNGEGIRELTMAQWTRKPVVIAISPSQLDQETIRKFMFLRFGYNPTNIVRNDAQRTDTQRQLAASRGATNEPIVLLRTADGSQYKLVEGGHRLMAYLLTGAPPEQLQILQNTAVPMNGINFASWNPVQIRAYVGTPTPAQQTNPPVPSASV